MPFLAGDASRRRISLTLFPLTTMRRFSGPDIGPYPHVRAYIERIAARPAYRRAMHKAEPGLQLPLAG